MNSLTSGIRKEKARWRRLSNASMGSNALWFNKLLVSATIINYIHASFLPLVNKTEDKIQQSSFITCLSNQ